MACCNVIWTYSCTNILPCFNESLFPWLSIGRQCPAHFKPSVSNFRLISSHQTTLKYVCLNVICLFINRPTNFYMPISIWLDMVAVVVSELECRENDAKFFSVCYRPSAYDQSGHSFEMGQRAQQLLQYRNLGKKAKKIGVNWGKKQVHWRFNIFQCD